MKKQTIYADWLMDANEMPTDISDFHISCGIGDGQDDGFFPEDAGSVLTIRPAKAGAGLFMVRLTHSSTRANQLLRSREYWLSPNCVEDVEAHRFGTLAGGAR